MAVLINPPQYEKDDSPEDRLYKDRQFVEDVIRAMQQINEDLTNISSGGGSGGGYPAQLGYAGVR